jgi:predicted GNAT superfamily acetyltransferase
MAISIYSVATIEECRAIEQLQIEIWGSTDLEVTPDHLLLTMAKEGGRVFLAANEAGQPIGFGYGFLGLADDGHLKLVSHQVGVLPAYQGTGLGYQLKLAQREAALADQLDLITWTFDPLQGRNARFNLHKLGAVCNTYLPELYGEMQDELNRGLPTDRFKVDWWITSAHVTDKLAGRNQDSPLDQSKYPVLNPAKILGNGLAEPPDTFDLPGGDDTCLVEIPADIQGLKDEAPDLARQWRLQTRQLFETAFADGYTAIDLLREAGRNFYLLQKDWQLPVGREVGGASS